MSLHQLANHMSAQGRGPDSTLVHMSPREVSGLQSLAMAHGGTLTINPQTGLPEAGFLDSLLPTLIGGAATFFSGGTITPMMAALGVGGLTALTSKDLGKGLMAGLGAYGGSGIMEGLAGFGAEALGSEAATASGSLVDNAAADAASKTAQTGASYSDKLSRGLTEGFKNPMGAVKAIGGGSTFKGAAMIGAPLLSALSSQDQTSVPTPEQIKFDPSYANINIRRDQLPYQRDTGSSAQRGYFGPTYVNQYAAEGGFVSDDGIEHFAVGGGIPLDPDYDYSGYGRKKTDVVRPVTPMPDVPKPDFLAADGKTYRYDPIKRSWYVIKEADAKTNAGVATLMDTGGLGGGQDKAPNTTPNWGATASIGKTLSDLGLNTIGGYLSQQAREGRTAQQEKATDIQDSSRDDTSGPMRGKSGDVDTDTGPAQAAPATAGNYADPSAVTGGIADLAAADKQAASDARENAREGIVSLGSGISPSDKSGGPAAAAAAAAAENPYDAFDTASSKAQNAIAAMIADLAPATAASNARGANQAAVDALAFEGAQTAANNGGGGGGGTGSGDGNSGGEAGGGFGAQANGGMVGRYAQGGLGSLGGYSDGGRLLRGPGDGVSDSIPATVGDRQPARLADGEFVVPARIVSELGNGSTEAGARALYKMMDRIQANRRKTTGKNSVAVNSKSHKYLPA